jgi:hypothetical protein
MNKSLLEAGHGLPFLIWKERNEILAQGLLTAKAGEVLKKFEGRSIKKPVNNKKLLCHSVNKSFVIE